MRYDVFGRRIPAVLLPRYLWGNDEKPALTENAVKSTTYSDGSRAYVNKSATQ